MVITVQVKGLDDLLATLESYPERLGVATEAAMRQAALAAESEIKALTPRKTGRLFSAWATHVTGTGLNSVGVIDDDVSYAPFVEEGTAPHVIEARGNALMLPVNKGGGFGGGRLSGAARSGQQVAFFKRVQHPGTQGKHMAEQGLRNATSQITRIFEMAVQRVLDGTK